MKKDDQLRGDLRLGGLLRHLRTTRGLTLASVAAKIGCAQSLLSQVETGARVLHPWLADALDTVYDLGGTISALQRPTLASTGHDGSGPGPDIIWVRVPRQGLAMPVSRRELLAALGIGAASGTLLRDLHRAVAHLRPDHDLLAEMRQTLRGIQAAGRIMAPARLLAPMTGQIGLIDALRHHAPEPLRREFTILQARYAEALSWMAEESADTISALYWIDRAHDWAQRIGWHSMTAYTHVRRSMLAISAANDGPAAVDHAHAALRVPNTPARIRGLATKQLAYGHALAHQPDHAKRALEHTVDLFTRPDYDDDGGPSVGQRSVNDPGLLAIYQATCDVYLGGADTVITTLRPHMTDINDGSHRTHAITTAKLAQAHAHAGDPATATTLILDTLDSAAAIDSLTTRRELDRAYHAVAARWPHRDDTHEAHHRLRHAHQLRPPDAAD